MNIKMVIRLKLQAIFSINNKKKSKNSFKKAKRRKKERRKGKENDELMCEDMPLLCCAVSCKCNTFCCWKECFVSFERDSAECVQQTFDFAKLWWRSEGQRCCVCDDEIRSFVFYHVYWCLLIYVSINISLNII